MAQMIEGSQVSKVSDGPDSWTIGAPWASISSVTRSEPSKYALAAEAWRPLARFFFDTVRHRQRILADHGLTPNDIRALVALDGVVGRSMRDLAGEWACDASNATWIVDRLEERGLAERRNDPTDRRVKLVVLTPLGRETRDRVFAAMFQPPAELLELSREDLVAIREAAARLPAGTAPSASASPARGTRRPAASEPASA
jgi:DNA-binding MarR family transcriptional regulator